MSAIRFEQVSLQFPGSSQPVVDHCSFEVAAGELVVILGPSGCGKTTLLKMVNRLYEPTSGRIFLDSIDISRLPATKLRQQIGYVIQQTGLFPHMTVAQNIAVVPKLLGWSRPEIQSRIDELLLLVQLSPTEYRDRYPVQLSGGQQQRIGLVRALAGNPKLMLMDEPFAALDAITRSTLQDEILRLHRHLRKTILFVSHDVEEALRLGDRMLILRQGKIVQFATPLQILTRPADDFVQQLVGAEDSVRRLSVLRVGAAMTCVSQNSDRNIPAIPPDNSLREALSLILKTGSTKLAVVENGISIGQLTLDQIRNSAYVDRQVENF
jgi:osmoprotectant transport system ATP-binding protein